MNFSSFLVKFVSFFRGFHPSSFFSGACWVVWIFSCCVLLSSIFKTGCLLLPSLPPFLLLFSSSSLSFLSSFAPLINFSSSSEFLEKERRSCSPFRFFLGLVLLHSRRGSSSSSSSLFFLASCELPLFFPRLLLRSYLSFFLSRLFVLSCSSPAESPFHICSRPSSAV